MKLIFIFVLVEFCIFLQAQKVYDYLGCWQHHGSSFLPEISLLHQKGHDTSLLHRCANAAHLSGIPVFGITNNSVCVGSVHASLIYMRYGPSTACYNGTGGPSTMDVYGLDGASVDTLGSQPEEEEKRNFINDLYSSSYGDHVTSNIMATLNNAIVQNGPMPRNAARHPLVKTGRVRPLMLQPLFKEIDELEYGVYRPPTSGVNILTNPGFEQPLVNDPVKGWSCQGEMDDPRGGVIARYTRHQAKQGQHSGICLARLSEWAGPGQYIGKVPVQGIIKMDSAHSSSNK